MRSVVRAASLALGLVAAAAGTALAQQQQVPKFAYINSQEILAVAPGRAEAEAQFQREMSTYQQQVKRMGDSLQTMIADYNKQEVVLSPAAKEAKQKLIRDKEAAFQQRTQDLQQQAQQRQMELMQPIMDKISKVLEDIRSENGYTMIFDAGSGANVVVAADKNLDITQQVIARLKATAGTTAKADTTKSAIPTAAPAGIVRPKPPAR